MYLQWFIFCSSSVISWHLIRTSPISCFPIISLRPVHDRAIMNSPLITLKKLLAKMPAARITNSVTVSDPERHQVVTYTLLRILFFSHLMCFINESFLVFEARFITFCSWLRSEMLKMMPPYLDLQCISYFKMLWKPTISVRDSLVITEHFHVRHVMWTWSI